MKPCPILRCGTRIESERCLCLPHWKMAPDYLKQRLWGERGPEGKRPATQGWEWRAAEIVNSVQDQETMKKLKREAKARGS